VQEGGGQENTLQQLAGLVLAEPLPPAEVERAAREMVETLEDLVDRRLSVLPGGVPIATEVLANVARAAAPVLGWDEARQAVEVEAFRRPEYRPT
jgi:glycerol-3-phosphate dehydrogenase